MGVDVTTYLMYGIKLDLKFLENKFKDEGEDFFDTFIKEIEGSEDARFDMVYDNMMGKSVVVGKHLASKDRHDGDKVTEIDLTKLPNASELSYRINEAFGIYSKDSDMKILLFNDYF